jgi:DNA-directed RNA polymerase specialized sigma24 family protein
MATQTTSPHSRTPAGRAALLDRLLARHARLLQAQARRHSFAEQDADDALQDACLRFLDKFDGSAEDLGHALRWMQVVTKRCAWEIGRRSHAEDSRRARPDHCADEEDPVRERLVSPSQGPAERAESRAELARKAGHFQKLKRDERIALALVALGYSYAEIQARLGWTHTKTNRCVAEGRAALRAMEGGRSEQPDR